MEVATGERTGKSETLTGPEDPPLSVGTNDETGKSRISDEVTSKSLSNFVGNDHVSSQTGNQPGDTDNQEPGTSENQKSDSQMLGIDNNQTPGTTDEQNLRAINKQAPGNSDNQEPGTSQGVKRKALDSGQKSPEDIHNELLQEIGSETVTLVNDSIVLDPELKRRKVDIFIDDPKPKWYIAEGKNITKTIDPQKLVEAFSFLPVVGRPECPSDIKKYQDSKIREFLGEGVDDNEFARLEDLCSPDNLLTGKELFMQTNIPMQGVWGMGVDSKDLKSTPPEEPGTHELCMVKKYKMRTEKDSGNTYSKKLKYRGMRIIPFPEDNSSAVNVGPPLQPGKDLLYRVRVYRTFPHMMRDKSDVFPSGFIFINNIFYTDTRAGCHDISARLRRWAATKPGLGVFPVMDMNLRLDQVKIKLGHPEVYMHQGNCEHLFTFSEIRLLNASDPLKTSLYPANTAISQNQSMYCTTCAEFSAKWIVTGCLKVPFDPAFFCDSCFKLYMFKDGKRIGNFKAFSYRGNELNMLKPQG